MVHPAQLKRLVAPRHITPLHQTMIAFLERIVCKDNEQSITIVDDASGTEP